MSVTLQQGLSGFDTEDILSLWVYEAAQSSCESLQADIANANETDNGFITSDVKNAQALADDNGVSFALSELPPDQALVFLAKVSNGSGEVLTHGCNQSEAIGQGNLLTLKIILGPLE